MEILDRILDRPGSSLSPSLCRQRNERRNIPFESSLRWLINAATLRRSCSKSPLSLVLLSPPIDDSTQPCSNAVVFSVRRSKGTTLSPVGKSLGVVAVREYRRFNTARNARPDICTGVPWNNNRRRQVGGACTRRRNQASFNGMLARVSRKRTKKTMGDSVQRCSKRLLSLFSDPRAARLRFQALLIAPCFRGEAAFL